MLGREHEMRRLKEGLRELSARYSSARKLMKDGRARLTQFEEQRELWQKDASPLRNEYSEVKAALESARYRMDQANARQEALAAEANDLDIEKVSAEEQLRDSSRMHVQAVETLERLSAEKAQLEAQRNELGAEVERVRKEADEDRQAVQSIAIQYESRRTSKDSAAQNLQRMQTQLVQFHSREKNIREQLEHSEMPLADSRTLLEEQLASRLRVEEELAESRRKVEHVDAELRELDQSRMQIDQAVE